MPRSKPCAPPSEAARLLELVDRLIQEVQPGTPLRATLDSVLDRDLGLDSLARVELLARVEDTFGLRLPSDTLATALTPRQLLAALEATGLRPAPVAAPHSRQSAPPRAADRPEEQATLIEVLQWHVARHPDRAHVIFYRDEQNTETLTYAQLAEAAGRIAAALAAAGLHPGQCVALMLPSGLDFFRCFFGILFAGGIPVPMYPPARPAQLEDHLRRQAGILRNCQAPLLITSELVRPLARLLTGLAPDLRQVLLPAQLQAATAQRAHAASADELALIQYTSGSTGDPKGVTLAHRNVLANIRAWGGAVALSSTDVCVSWLPLYHDMGLIVAWLGSLYHACPLVLLSPLDFLARPESWLWAIHRHRGTVAAAPNFAYDLCVRRLEGRELSGLDLSSWRLAANGAEPISPDTLGRFADCFAPYGLRREILTPAYGLAEATVGLAVPPPGRGVQVDRVAREPFMTQGLAEPAAADDAQALRFVSCGPALPGHTLRIVDDSGQPLAERQVGHLEFRGPSATAGYYRNPTASAGLFHGDWLETGDYAYLAGGEVHITGRSKDLIIRGGRNFYPYDLEQAVGELPGVRRGCVAVFGIPATTSAGERLVVVAETRERDPAVRTALERRIVALAAEQLGLPPDVVVLAPPHSVLKTSSGKIRRAAIREAFEHGTLGASAQAPWLQVLHLAGASLPGRLHNGASALRAWLFGAWVWGCCGLLAPLAVLAILLLPSLPLRWTATHWLLRLLAGLCACPLHVAGVERLPRAPCVLVANHASYIDALLLIATLPRAVGFVAKAEFKRQPLLRRLFERMGSHFVERSDASQGVEDVQTLAALAGTTPSLLFFAEGTFSAQAGLRPFRLGAFQIAVQQDLQVVPVALAGTRQVLPDGCWWPRRGPLTVTVCPPLAPAGTDWHATLALRAQAREAILAHCGEADLGGAGHP